MSWADGPVLSLDLETTSENPAIARICSFALLAIDAQRVEHRRSEYRLVNPGIDVPASALAIHGLTEEMLAAGMDHDQAVYYLNRELHRAVELAIPVVVYNARYDVTLLYARSRELGLSWPDNLFVVDPLTIDRGMNKTRVGGSRKLGLLASTYGVHLADAHDAAADAKAAALLAFAMAERHLELRCSAEALMKAQRRANQRWAAGFQKYLRKRGKRDTIELGWPILEALR